jgi:hypothetical protein
VAGSGTVERNGGEFAIRVAHAEDQDDGSFIFFFRAVSR